MTAQQPLDEQFRASLAAMPPHARVARAVEMFVWARDVIRRQILAREGTISAERMKWETAMRLYGRDATSRALIQRMLDHVSH